MVASISRNTRKQVVFSFYYHKSIALSIDIFVFEKLISSFQVRIGANGRCWLSLATVSQVWLVAASDVSGALEATLQIVSPSCFSGRPIEPVLNDNQSVYPFIIIGTSTFCDDLLQLERKFLSRIPQAQKR